MACLGTLLVLSIIYLAHCRNPPPGGYFDIMDFDAKLGEQLNAAFWRKKGVNTLRTRLDHLKKAGIPPLNKGKPVKNVILFMGDGHGIASVTASRKYKEQFSGTPFYESELAVESFPFSGFAKTYQLDSVVAESAGTATAYLTGVKTRLGFIGLDGSADLDCSSTKGHVDSIAHWASRAGKSVGLVTTTTITHASPSPLYGRMPAPLRDYEYSSDKFPFSKTHPKCKDLARQFVKNGRHIKVALGGGRAYFTPDREIPQGDTRNGSRNDGRNLIEEWLADRCDEGRQRATYVTNRDELQRLDPKSVDYLLGMFSYKHMTYMDDSPPPSEPTLTEMTTAAIRVLREDADGFFLFVESGRIDHGHHDSMARYALTEALELDRAINQALDMTDASETLIVVTADHSHTLSISGYIGHNSSILGLSASLGTDGKPYTILTYANGPGFNLTGGRSTFADGSRRNVSLHEAVARGYQQQAAVPLLWEDHGGEDVPVYANGLHAALLSGTFEQSYIPYAMACAAGIYGPLGEVSQHMSQLCPKPYQSSSNSAFQHRSHLAAFAILLMVAAN